MSGILSALPGVEDVKVDFASKTATCTVKNDIDASKLAESVTGRFSASVKQ